jgi:hypothetical protein
LPEIPPALPFSKGGELWGIQEGNASVFPPLIKGSCEKIEWREAKASFVARGGGKFTAPKPGGRCMAGKNFPDLRKATPATCENSHKRERMIVSASVV